MVSRQHHTSEMSGLNVVLLKMHAINYIQSCSTQAVVKLSNVHQQTPPLHFIFIFLISLSHLFDAVFLIMLNIIKYSEYTKLVHLHLYLKDVLNSVIKMKEYWSFWTEPSGLPFQLPFHCAWLKDMQKERRKTIMLH